MFTIRRLLIALILPVVLCAGKAEASCTTLCVLTVTASNTTNYSSYSTYEWFGTATGRTETIGTSCTSANNSVVIIIKDGLGNAGIIPIAIVTSSTTDTIDGVVYTATTTPLMLNTPFQAITLQCDGAGNWMTE